MTKVSVIIVNWNTGELLVQCVQSLLRLPEKNLIEAIVVIDNASTDDSIIRLESVVLANDEAVPAASGGAFTGGNKLPVHLLKQAQNVGFARANNLGIHYIHRTRASRTHILLLNPDTKVQSGALEQMVMALDHHPGVGIVGPKLLNADRTQQLSVRRLPTLPIFIGWFLKLSRVAGRTRRWREYLWTDFNYEQEQIVEQVMGAAFLIHQELLTTIGYLDERFWVWLEEVDYCRRASAAGWKILYVPAAVVLHYGGISFNQLIGWQRSWPFFKSCLHYTRKHLGTGAYVLLILLLPLALVLTIPAILFHLGWRNNNEKIKSHV
ncbi:MAG: glycosyltransferase family 2 protein [Candidatus Andersenbacteria bacterium]